MSKYQVTIARNETTIYVYEVEADDEDEAEEVGYALYNQGEEPVDEDVVYGEEEVHSVAWIED